MAKRFWPNEDPIGKHLTLYFSRDLERVVVGVVGDVKMDAISQTRPTEAVYTPLAQITPTPGEDWHSFGMNLAVRTHGEPSAIVAEVSDAIHQIDSEVPLLNITTMQDFVSESVAPQRFTMQLLAAFAGLAVVLAAIGIYSVLSYSVRRRTSEIGIRMALGAQISDVVRMIISDGMKPTLLGIGIGLAGALALARAVSSVIFGVSARDIATYASVSVLLALVGVAATIVPAVRASRVEPVKTLREE
jgi:ABC-type antimicrobial peptide transport system permease subunit